MLVIGDNEKNSSTLSVRKKHEGDIGKLSLEELFKILKEELNSN